MYVAVFVVVGGGDAGAGVAGVVAVGVAGVVFCSLYVVVVVIVASHRPYRCCRLSPWSCR